MGSVGYKGNIKETLEIWLEKQEFPSFKEFLTIDFAYQPYLSMMCPALFEIGSETRFMQGPEIDLNHDPRVMGRNSGSR